MRRGAAGPPDSQGQWLGSLKQLKEARGWKNTQAAERPTYLDGTGRAGKNIKEENTVILPGYSQEVEKDIAGIAEGKATWIPDGERYEINGRTYGRSQRNLHTMTYNLFLVDSCDPGVITESLAAIFRVPESEVNVADAEGDQEDRNWDALASCEYSRVLGNVSLYLDIYAQDSVEEQPPEAEFSAALSGRLGTPVLCPPQESAMSAHWLVTPEGLTTRARLSESDDDEPTFTVTAVEAFVDRLPGVPVIHLPEVVREQKIATPLADSFAESLQSLKGDGNEADGSPFTAEVAEVARIAKSYLRAWEKLSRRAENNWEPSGWYPVGFYQEVLGCRDDIEGYLRQLPEDVATLYKRYLDKVDSLYQELTVDDEEHVVVDGWDEPTDGSAQKAWWWYRRPEPMPWFRG